MAIRKIFTDDAECLYKVCRPVEHFNKRLYDLLDDMAETMYNAEESGLRRRRSAFCAALL